MFSTRRGAFSFPPKHPQAAAWAWGGGAVERGAAARAGSWNWNWVALYSMTSHFWETTTGLSDYKAMGFLTPTLRRWRSDLIHIQIPVVVAVRGRSKRARWTPDDLFPAPPMGRQFP
jgi:hypothetical protein